MHDFFLSGIVAHREWHGGEKGLWSRELYLSHGYPALLYRRDAKSESDAVWKYPCNGSVLDEAAGIIVHSENGVRLARQWYGDKQPNISTSFHCCACRPPRIPDKGQKRQALGIADTDFLVCSFGMIGPTKLSHRLVEAWHAGGLGSRRECKLVLVGENERRRVRARASH